MRTKRTRIHTVQRHCATHLDRHEVHDPLGIEVLLADAELFNNNIGESGVGCPNGSHIGRRTQKSHLHLGFAGQKGGLARAASVVGDERIVVKNDASKRMREVVRGGWQKTVLQKTSQSMTLSAALGATDEDRGRRSDIVVYNITVGLGHADPTQEAKLRKCLVFGRCEASGVQACFFSEDWRAHDLV